MPTPALQSFAKQSGKSAAEVEKLWKKAKKVADDMGEGGNYAYVTGVLKSMLGLDEQEVHDLMGSALAEAACSEVSYEFEQDYQSKLQAMEIEGQPMVSTSFPVLPETPPKKTVQV